MNNNIKKIQRKGMMLLGALLAGALSLGGNGYAVHAGAEEHTHAFTDGHCSCGAFLMEAETAFIEGVSSSSDGDQLTVSGIPHLSGEGCVECFAHPGNSVTWLLEADKTYENVVLDFVMCYCVGDDNLQKVEIYVNGEKADWTTTELHHTAITGETAWYEMGDHYTAGVTITENTVIKLVNVAGASINIDCVILQFPADAQVAEGNYDEYDNTAPEIGTISFDKVAPCKGDEIGFEFTVSDNRTAQEDIAVSVSVYLNYGAEEEKEIPLTNGKFVATEAGAYTVVVTAKDAAGNESSKLRRVLVSEKTEEEPTPDNPKPNEPGNNGDNRGDDVQALQEAKPMSVAIAILGGTALTLGVFTAIVVVFRKKPTEDD